GVVVVLPPPPLAPPSPATRMAALLGQPVGQTVGYTTGEERKVSAATRIEVVTEGVLVRRVQRDPAAAGISAVILDEFHERAITADLALAFSLEIQQTLRPDLRILVMSATLEGDRVVDLLGQPAVHRSQGRIHKVVTEYHLHDAAAGVGHIVAMGVRQALDCSDGDVLAFLPGRREIADAQAELRGIDAEVVPLYGALPASRQQQALRPRQAGRRVVLATDIAESSLTVPGVRIVVDGGWSRRPAFDPTTGMSRLRTVRVSRASADQRRGRAAREGPGLCLRMWPQHLALTPHSPPAILVEDLAPTALEISAWGTDLQHLALLDEPPAVTWAAAHELLAQLGAVDLAGRLTDHGRAMVELPVHPRLAHMVLQSPSRLRPLAADIAALLAQRDVLPEGGTDLEQRVAALQGRGRRGDVASGAVARVRVEAARIRRLTQSGHEVATPKDDDVGRLVALAYPDRIARSRGRRGAFVMAGGRGATMRQSDSLAGQEMIAVAAVDRGAVDAQIHLAAALDPATVAELARPVDVIEWRDGDVIAERQRRYGSVVLSISPVPDPPRQLVIQAVLVGVAAEGLRPLPWAPATRALRDRLAHLHREQCDQGWPAMDDDTLIAQLDQWLAPFLTQVRRRRDLADLPLAAALMSRVPFGLHSSLDVLAPPDLRVPTGRTEGIDYSGERPVVAVKLQEMFGLTSTPVIAGRPVLLHLLSPAGRPLQVTDDLAAFWAGSYGQVRAEMRGRYPKHPWPEDPSSATPTRHTKRRQRAADDAG
ncbi:MAG: ATP-dependent helicase HrpB, partial [Euzebya sp.]